MPRYMLDTNICIYVIKQTPLNLLSTFNERQQDLCISSVTLGELHYGAEKSARVADNLLVLEEFAARLQVLQFGASEAAHFGQLKAHLERMGTPCGPFDIMIGAHARSDGLTLVTNNRREFDRMPGLIVENWV